MKSPPRPTGWLVALAFTVAAHGSDAPCPDHPLTYGFYAYFEPVSYSAGRDPGTADFDHHLGYEADLLTALEAMADGPEFSRRGLASWAEVPPPIWLRSVGEQFDVIGGGITILPARTHNASGRVAVAFTNGHIAFRQSLLVRTADADRLATHAGLQRSDAVGVIAGTTGESRLLQLVGYASDAGTLAAGTRATLADGSVVVADGSANFFVTAAGAAPELDGRRRLDHPAAALPQVVYLDDEGVLIAALREGRIDAIARGEIGNRGVSRDYPGLVVAALDPQVEWGGFTVDAEDDALLVCLNRRIDYLTDNRRIGYAQWDDDPRVFLRRAWRWEPIHPGRARFLRGWRLELLEQAVEGPPATSQ